MEEPRLFHPCNSPTELVVGGIDGIVHRGCIPLDCPVEVCDLVRVEDATDKSVPPVQVRRLELPRECNTPKAAEESVVGEVVVVLTEG